MLTTSTSVTMDNIIVVRSRAPAVYIAQSGMVWEEVDEGGGSDDDDNGGGDGGAISSAGGSAGGGSVVKALTGLQTLCVLAPRALTFQ